MKSFLKTHNSKSSPKVYVEKSISLITAKLTNPCCTDLGATIDLHTKFDNELSTGVARILHAVPLKGNRKSYAKAKTILQNYIGIGCCIQ